MTARQTAAPVTNKPRRPRVLAAGARDLIAWRDAGRHPRMVVVVVASRFASRRYAALAAFLGAPAPLMALADEIEARALSWYPLRGLGAALCVPEGPRLRRAVLLSAIAQLAAEAAPVLLFNGGPMNDPASLADDAADLLFDARFEDAAGRWPAGWSQAQHDDYHARTDRWVAEGDA